jgi:hypothetical protein
MSYQDILLCWHMEFCAIDGDWLLFIFLFVKSVCTDLDSLRFIHHFLVQIATLLTADCSFLLELPTVSAIAMTAVSPASVAMVLFNVCKI